MLYIFHWLGQLRVQYVNVVVICYGAFPPARIGSGQCGSDSSQGALFRDKQVLSQHGRVVRAGPRRTDMIGS